MKKLLCLLRERSLFLRYLGGLILSAFLLTSLISGATFYVSQQRLGEQLNIVEQHYLSSVSESVSSYIQLSRQTANSIATNAFVKQSILSGSEEWTSALYNCLLAVKQALSTNSCFASICLVSGDSILIKSERNYQSKEYDALMVDMIVRHSSEPAIPWRMSSSRRDYSYLSIPHTIDTLQAPNNVGGVLVTLDMERVAERVFAGSTGVFYIVDESGQVVLSSDSAAFLLAADDLPALRAAINGDSEVTLNNERYVVGSKPIDEFWLYHFTPHRQFYGSLKQFGTLVLLILLGCVLLAIPLSLLLAKRAYRPVKNVMIQLVSRLPDRQDDDMPVNELQRVSNAIVHIYETIDAYREDIDASAMRACLINGLASDADDERLRNYLGDFSCLRLIVVSVPEDTSSVQRATDIASGCLSGSFSVTSVSTGENTITLILSDNRPIEEETLRLLLDGAMASLEQLMPQAVFFAVSPCVNDIKALHDAYTYAVRRIATSALYARSACIRDICDEPVSVPDIETACTHALQRNRDGFIQSLRELCEQYKPFSNEKTCEQLALLSARMQQCQSVLPLHSADTLPLFSEEYRRLRTIRSHSALLTYFMDLFLACAEQDGAQESESKRLAELSIEYIAQHFSDSALGASEVADALHISVSHFSRILKKHTGKTFLEVVTSYRMQKAAELLTGSPELSINELSQTCGFSSPSYFTALFKKCYGVTPSGYRSRTSTGV